MNRKFKITYYILASLLVIIFCYQLYLLVRIAFDNEDVKRDPEFVASEID